MTDSDDVRVRLKDSLARMSERAYREAARPVTREPLGVRSRLDRRPAVVLSVVFVAVLVLTWVSLGTTGEPAPVVSIVGGDPADAVVVVHVTGAVASPGVVSLDAGARVADAVEAVGGLVPGADESAVNLARPVRDGEQVYVPFLGEGDPGRVNLNRATPAELETLPGIGPVLAERIVSDRERNGPFSSVDDLARVSGIGGAVVADLDALATV